MPSARRARTVESARPLEHVPDVAGITAELGRDVCLPHAGAVQPNHFGRLIRCHPRVAYGHTVAPASLERLAYALIGISPMLSVDEIASITWPVEPAMLAMVELTSGPIITVNVGLETSGSNLANVVMTAFDLMQQELAETEGYWGRALPPCRPDHAHPATCAELGNAVALVCPEDQQVLRILVTFPTPSAVQQRRVDLSPTEFEIRGVASVQAPHELRTARARCVRYQLALVASLVPDDGHRPVGGRGGDDATHSGWPNLVRTVRDSGGDSARTCENVTRPRR